MTNHPGKIVCDLDGVIAGAKPVSGDYRYCVPNVRVIRRLRELKDLGWTIAIHTSRNVKTYDGNIGKIMANTAPVIQEWLVKHKVPYDELHVAKPWVGEVGFYVDDRAVRPQEFLELSTNELLNQARGSLFDPDELRWQRGNNQSWAVLDLRLDDSGLLDGSVLRAARQLRDEEGWRLLIILHPRRAIIPGFDEELRRAGVRWARYDTNSPITEATNMLMRELVLDGLASHESLVNSAVIGEGDRQLASRHFNQVHIAGDRVNKTSAHGPTYKKLEFEKRWLQAIGKKPNLVPNRVETTVGGYSMDLLRGGTLAQVLLRDNLTELEIKALAHEVNDLWWRLEFSEPVVPGSRSIRPWRKIRGRQLQREYKSLIFDKTMARWLDLDELLVQITGSDTHAPWILNGLNVGSVGAVLSFLLGAIPKPVSLNRGVWHGDMCPGNIVLESSIHSDDPVVMRLIDPRGTIDNKTMALYGDRRYDMAKLSHAVRWGYDAITEGWRDCQWTIDQGVLDVELRVWDEGIPNHEPNRTKLWNELVKLEIQSGAASLDDPEIHALAALQLITCAPLHSEDTERVIALISRGIQAAVHAGYDWTKHQ